MSKTSGERISRAPLMNEGRSQAANLVSDAESVMDAEEAAVDAGRQAWERPQGGCAQMLG
jgi:hypothetical protein